MFESYSTTITKHCHIIFCLHFTFDTKKNLSNYSNLYKYRNSNTNHRIIRIALLNYPLRTFSIFSDRLALHFTRIESQLICITQQTRLLFSSSVYLLYLPLSFQLARPMQQQHHIDFIRCLYWRNMNDLLCSSHSCIFD